MGCACEDEGQLVGTEPVDAPTVAEAPRQGGYVT